MSADPVRRFRSSASLPAPVLRAIAADHLDFDDPRAGVHANVPPGVACKRAVADAIRDDAQAQTKIIRRYSIG